jgi:uncharacterized protein YacL
VDVGERLKRTTLTEKFAVFAGFVIGLLITFILVQLFGQLSRILTLLLGIIITVMTTYLGVVMMENVKLEEFIMPSRQVSSEDKALENVDKIKMLDTNVIIDGRVADVCRTGFLDGPIYVPGFVLDELQHIADSSDALKRARGRRGLYILNQLRSEMHLLVRSLDNKTEYLHSEEVDARLVKLAKKLDAMIVTNDFNLNKVAELQGVPVLNINELANALRPVVLPGEQMRVTVIKEGKEMGQGIAYLDDGTMIIIEGARRHVGDTVDVIVDNILQSQAGKMIFASMKQSEDSQNDDNDDGPDDFGPGGNPRGYSGGRQRRPLR